MSLRSYIQDHPAPLVWSWEATAWVLRRIKPLFAKMGMETSSKIVKVPEEVVKGLLFNCQDCAQCVLHYTGMTCPMNCPKHMRNGPCGGVRPDGHCEVKPEMPCVWLLAWRRSERMSEFGAEILASLPPLDRRLQGTSAWINDFTGAANRLPAGWDS